MKQLLVRGAGCVGLFLAFLSGPPAATADPVIPLADPVMLHLRELGMDIRRQKFFDQGTGVVVQRKFAPMLARQLTARCRCKLSSLQCRCFKMST